MNYEPLVPTGFIMGRLDIEKLPMQEMIDWLLTNQDNTINEFTNLHTQGEDIPISSEVDCFQDLMNVIDEGMENFTKGQVEIESVWGQVQHKGQCTAYHNHIDPYRPPTMKDLSFVFYLQASEEHGALVFPMEMYKVDYTKRVLPNTGGLIIFPAHINHYTMKNNDDSPRIVVSGNYREKGFKEFNPEYVKMKEQEK